MTPGEGGGDGNGGIQIYQSAGPRPSIEMNGGLVGNTVYRDLDRDDAAPHVGSEPAGDITAAVATVASRAAINASTMAKADENTRCPCFPIIRRHAKLDDILGLGMRLL